MKTFFRVYFVCFAMLAIFLAVVLHFIENPEDQIKKIESEISEVSPESSDFEETIEPSLEKQIQDIFEVKTYEKKVQDYKELLIVFNLSCKVLVFLIPIFGIGLILKMIIPIGLISVLLEKIRSSIDYHQ